MVTLDALPAPRAPNGRAPIAPFNRLPTTQATTTKRAVAVVTHSPSPDAAGGGKTPRVGLEVDYYYLADVSRVLCGV